MSELTVEQLRDVFDPEFYLSTYTDIAAAGVDPWEHYFHHGFYEHRLPYKFQALQLEELLWQEQNEDRIDQLNSLLTHSNTLEQGLAAWALARWYGSYRQWPEVEQHLTLFFASGARCFVPHQGPLLLYFSSLYYQDKLVEARHFLDKVAIPEFPKSADLVLASSMVCSEEDKFHYINRLWQAHGLEQASYIKDNHTDDACLFDRLTNFFSSPSNTESQDVKGPLVSIIIPCYNAETTITAALRSLLAQTWRNIEILVVDDASTDQSAKVVSDLASYYPQITLIRHLQNQGAYAARNTALALAKGDYITVHDADDWSHPNKIEKQVECLSQNNQLKACATHWIRSTNELAFEHWRIEDAWIYRNVSSLMFTRVVFTTLGFWDRVSVNADTEYYYRILKVFGRTSIEEVLPGTPLAFGRVLEAALTSQGVTHLRTQFKGLRKDYHEAALAWHQTSESLYLSQYPKQRPFPIPDLMCRRFENTLIKPARRYIEGVRCQNIGFVKQHYDALKRGDTESSEQFLAFIPKAIWS